MSLEKHFLEYCSEEDLEVFTSIPTNNIAINSLKLFNYFEDKLDRSLYVLDILEAFASIAKKSAIKNFNREPHTGSLNNSRGRWFELIFFREFCRNLEIHNEKEMSKLKIFKLPSATKNKKIYDIFIEEQKKELVKINPSTSNPDFIIVKCMKNPKSKTYKSTVDAYQDLSYFGKIDMRDLVSIISIKTSARPDRRYQQVYEANLIRALFERLKFSLNFICVTLHENEKNNEVYNSPSIISILKDDNSFKSAINNTFTISKISDTQKVYNYILKSTNLEE